MNWEYCECGCHGHEASAGGIYLWLFNDLKGNYTLHRGHGWMSPVIGKYKSWEEAETKAREVMTEGLKKAVLELRAMLKKPRKRKKA
jgi:hypothetical protein